MKTNVYKVPAPAGKVSLTLSDTHAKKLRDVEYQLGNAGISTSSSAIVHHALATFSVAQLVTLIKELATQ